MPGMAKQDQRHRVAAGSRRRSSPAVAAAMLGALLLVASGSPPAGPAVESGSSREAAGLSLILAAPLLVDLIAAATPYRLELDAGLFHEVVVLSRPRNIRLVAGGLDLEMTATGSPIPFTAEVSPRVRLVRGDDGGWRVVVEKLPVTIGLLGTYDLASFIEPVAIETVTPYLLELPGGTIDVDLIVSDIKISAREIRIELRASFPARATP